MFGIFTTGAMSASVIPGLNDKPQGTSPTAAREHRRNLGKRVDENLRALAKAHGLNLGEMYDPFDAWIDVDGRKVFVDFKFIGVPSYSEYAGWTLFMHFSNNEFQFAKKNNLTFIVYVQMDDTEVIKCLHFFEFEKALEKGAVQMNEKGKDLWWSIDLFQLEPNLRSKFTLSM